MGRNVTLRARSRMLLCELGCCDTSIKSAQTHMHSVSPIECTKTHAHCLTRRLSSSFLLQVLEQAAAFAMAKLDKDGCHHGVHHPDQFVLWHHVEVLRKAEQAEWSDFRHYLRNCLIIRQSLKKKVRQQKGEGVVFPNLCTSHQQNGTSLLSNIHVII